MTFSLHQGVVVMSSQVNIYKKIAVFQDKCEVNTVSSTKRN